MKKLALATFTASSLVMSGGAFAADMFIDLGSNAPDEARGIGTPDADTQTAIFNEFGFSQLLATSIYDFSDGTVFGDFFDSNIESELTAVGIPASGTALDGTTTVTLGLPNCELGQCDIDALSPLVPPLRTDNEGFLQSWTLQLEYHFDGTLTPDGPVYTGGFFEATFNDLTDGDILGGDRLVLSGDLVSSDVEVANLELFFELDFALDDFLWIDTGAGFMDAADRIAAGFAPILRLDTNVDPSIPTADELLLVDGNAIRQTRLDGSITPITAIAIPEPGTLALMGLGLLGLGGALRRKV